MRLRRALALTALAAAFAALLPRAGSAADPVEIPMILPLTGPGAFIGHEQQLAADAVETAVNASGGIRGRPVALAIQDDQSRPEIAVQLVQSLRAKHVAFIAGPSWAASCAAVMPLAARDGPLVYCLSNAIRPPAGGYVFSAIQATNDMLTASLRYFRERGWKRVAYIVGTDATGQDAERAISAALAAEPELSVVDREHFAPSDISVAAQMTRIKAASPQAVIAWAAGASAATLFRGEFDAGLDVPTLTSPGNLGYRQLTAWNAFLPRMLFFPGSTSAAPDAATTRPWKRALAAFDDAVSSPDVRPDQILAGTWDPLTLIVSGLRKLGPDASAAALRDYVAGTKDWAGALGVYDFRAIPQRGLDASSVVMIRWDKTRGTWLAASRPGGRPLAAR